MDFKQSHDSTNPLKNLLWTTDNTVELPIVMKKSGYGSEAPITLIEMIKNSSIKYP